MFYAFQINLLKRLRIIIEIIGVSFIILDISARYLNSISEPNEAPIVTKLIIHITDILNIF